MITLDLQLPSREGFDLENGEDLDDIFGLYDKALHDLSEQIREQANNPNYIVVNGKSLEQSSQAEKWVAGDIKMFSGTYAQAQAQASSGWRICDGTFGTPDLRGKFARGAATGVSAGGTGGSAVHGHGATISGHSHPIDNANLTVSEYAAHAHTIGAGGGGVAVACCAAGVVVSCCAHDHGGNTGTAGAHDHDVDGTTESEDAAVAIDDGGALPPYVDIIYLMFRGTI